MGSWDGLTGLARRNSREVRMAMIEDWKKMIWLQFGASIDMLENAIVACPESVWGDLSSPTEFWYLAYHTLFFLDYYLADTSKEFAPPEPFTLSELDPSGKYPDRVYTKEELLTYLRFGRARCKKVIASLTEERAFQPCGFERRPLTVVELLLYSMRHVQHHAAQMNLILRKRVDSAPRWVGQTKDPL